MLSSLRTELGIIFLTSFTNSFISPAGEDNKKWVAIFNFSSSEISSYSSSSYSSSAIAALGKVGNVIK